MTESVHGEPQGFPYLGGNPFLGGVDLVGYASRIGYSGPFEANLVTLTALAEKHVRSIPFENLDVLLGRPIELSAEAFEAKLVKARRGGYCFEQNGLMLQVLSQIGFNVRALSGRVRLESTREDTPPRTHLFLVVNLQGEDWIFDGGVGGLSLTSPIRLRMDEHQFTLHETRRIVFEENRYFHQAWMGEYWQDVYEFTGEQMPLIDRMTANWWTSTNPTSKFANNLFAARAESDGVRVNLLNDRLTWRRGADILEQKQLGSVDEVLQVLAEVFDLAVPEGMPVERLFRPTTKT